MFDNPDEAEAALFFHYTDEQWARIVQADGIDADALDRGELETLAQCMRFTHQQINADSVSKTRTSEIQKLKSALDVLVSKGEPLNEPAVTLVRELREQIERRNYVDKVFRSIHGKHQNSACREFFLRHCMGIWDEMGLKVGRNNPNSKWQPDGPMVIWLQACSDPVFADLDGPKKKARSGSDRLLGETSASTVDGVIRKSRKQRAKPCA